MTPLLRPVGPLPTSVYWVRRVIALLVAVAIGWLGVWALPGGGAGDADARTSGERPTAIAASSTGTSTPTGAPRPSDSPSIRSEPATGPGPSTSPSPTGKSPASDVGGPPKFSLCAAKHLRVSVAVPTTSIQAGAALAVRVDVRNDAARCGLSVGPVTLRVQIVSGSDLIWDTSHCPGTVQSKRLTLERGTTHVATVTWPGNRSRAGCPERQKQALPGYYSAQARLIGIASSKVRFRVS